MYLKECFRCTQSIVNVFQKIVGKNNIIGKYDSTFRTPKNMGSEIFYENLVNKCEFRNIKTIHSVKGQTFDSIMLVSNEKKGTGTNWEEWLIDTNSEYARICYVASSRPRELNAVNLRETCIKSTPCLGFNTNSRKSKNKKGVLLSNPSK